MKLCLRLVLWKICFPGKPALENNTESAKIVCSPCLRQGLAALGPLLLTVVVGMTLGYSAVLLPQLQAVTNENNGLRLNREESSWVASLAVLPMAAGTLLGALVIQKYGRKKTHIITCLPYFAGWLLMYFATNLEMLLTGRFLTGLCSGMLGPATGVYIGETSEPKYRGVLLGGIPLSVSIGLLASHILGTFLTWQTTSLIISLFPLVSWIIMTFAPESPAWLAQQGSIDKAQKSFFWLRGNSDESREELEQILAKHKENSTGMDNKDWRDNMIELLSPEFWKPMGILLIFFITSQWAGVNAVNFYSVTFMKQTLGSNVNEYLATFIIDCIRLISSLVACILLRRLGRRPLALIGGLGTFIPLFILSGFIYYTRAFNITVSLALSAVPITCLLAYIFFVTAGFVTLPWNLLGELLPMAKKSIGSGIASCIAYLSLFSVVKTMPVMFEVLGTDGTFFIYGSMALIGTIFVFFCLPETKGKTLHEIEEYFKVPKNSDDNKDAIDIRL